MDFINDLIIQAAASPWLYLVTFVAAVIDGFFPPIPSETVLVAAAAVADSTGRGSILGLCLAAAAGAMIGDNIAYAIGRSVGTRRLRWMRRPRVTASFEWAQRNLQRSAAGFILGGRFLPIGRVAVNMSAGALSYPWSRFLPLSLIAALTWSAYSTAIGVLAGHWLQDQPLLSGIVGLIAAIIIGVLIDRFNAIRRRRGLVRAYRG